MLGYIPGRRKKRNLKQFESLCGGFPQTDTLKLSMGVRGIGEAISGLEADLGMSRRPIWHNAPSPQGQQQPKTQDRLNHPYSLAACPLPQQVFLIVVV